MRSVLLLRSFARLRPLTGVSAGVQNFTNLAFGDSLIGLDWAWGNTSTPGLWDFNGCVGGCIPNKTGVIGEPYCGGATGLMPGWQVGVRKCSRSLCVFFRSLKEAFAQSGRSTRSRTARTSRASASATNPRSGASRTPRCASSRSSSRRR